MDKNKDNLLEHEYDGIQELDNDLPPWWLWLFFITIIFAIVYMIHYHVIGSGDLSAVEYKKQMNPNYVEEKGTTEPGFSIEYRSPFYKDKIEMTPQLWAMFDKFVGPNVEFDVLLMEAMQRANTNDLSKLKESFPDIYARLSEGGGAMATAESTEEETKPVQTLDYKQLTDAASLEAGKQIYTTNCASCHGAQGQGGIGPNMTDNYYIHGGSINDLMSVIINGVPIKGMIAWKGILSDEQMLQVASYMMSLRGTNPPNPKAAQGELVEFPE